MKLNRRIRLLILPVLFTSFLIIAIGLYVVERNSIYSLNRSSAELEATQLAGSFSQYILIGKSFLASLIQSDALRYFLDSKDEHFKSLTLSSGLDGVLNNLTDISADHFSITFLQGDGVLEYYYENSLDPFSTPDSDLQSWASELSAAGVSSASRYYTEKGLVAFCRILDRLTLKPPLKFGTSETFVIIVALSPTNFLDRSNELSSGNRTLTFWEPDQTPGEVGQFESRRQLPGFGTIAVKIEQQTVDQSLWRIFQRMFVGFLLLIGLTYLVLQQLIRRYVIMPINRLESQLGQVDLDATQEIEVYRAKDEIGNLSLAFARLYGKLKETYETTRELAECDTLTSLYNRRVFNLTLKKLLDRAEMTGQCVGLLYIDIDNFKFVNDHYGHTIGDALLRAFALRLHEVVRGGDVIYENVGEDSTAARIAGDEFAVIVHGYANKDVAGKVARRILRICENGFAFSEGHFPISLSIGVASFPEDGSSADELIINADSAMYRSKKSGKNKVSFFSASEWEIAKRQQLLELHLKQIDFNEFELYYMPIVAADSGQIYSFEALIRWHSKELGNVSPGEFIPLVESLGLYQKLDLWVMERAFKESATLRERFGENIRISINVSAAELSQRDFVEKVFALVQKYQIKPEMFMIEITETFYQDHSVAGINLQLALSEAGFQLAIDDLGSGYSSLLQLVEFPVSMVKLDMVFINRSLAGKRERVLRSLVELCHVQDVRVIAEGVEEDQAINILRDAGCDYLQGYFFSKPIPIAEVLALPDSFDF